MIDVEDHHVDIKHQSGQVVTLTVDEDTTFALGSKPADARWVTKGRFVNVDVDGTSGQWHAHYIRVARRRSDPS